MRKEELKHINYGTRVQAQINAWLYRRKGYQTDIIEEMDDYLSGMFLVGWYELIIWK